MDPDHEQHWDENTALEIVDLPPPETESVAGVLAERSLRIFRRIRSLKEMFKVSFTAKQEGEEGVDRGERVDDDYDFELRFIDLAALPHAQEQEAEITADSAAYSVQDSDSILETTSPVHKWREMSRMRQMRVFSPLSCLLLLVIGSLAGSGSALYQPATPLSVARPNFSDSSIVIIADHGIGISTFDAADQGQMNGWHTRLSDNSTIVIPGVAIGHSNAPGGVADWTAATMPANCAVSKDPDAVYSSGHISLWLVGTSSPYTVVHLQHITSSNLNTWKGWQLLIGILMKRGFTGPVTLTVGNQSYGPSPSFRGLFDGPPLTSLLVDIRQVPPYVVQSALRSRILWNIPLYLPGAGCYTIQTRWPGGNHLITISAGQ